MKVTFVQTSDPIVYYPMLQETSRTIRRYCLINGFSYEQFVGIKRGHMAWQASFNRIYMLKELLDEGRGGWVFYLDADAFIIDMRFDLVGYLADKAGYGAIFAGHIGEVYDVNTGGFAVNLSHPAGKALILEYHAAFEATVNAAFYQAISWETDVVNDQYILYLVLKRWHEDFDFNGNFLFEHTNRSYVNNGPFISQQLRFFHASFEERLAAIREKVDSVMEAGPVPHEERGSAIYVPASHPRLITQSGNKTDAGIWTNGAAGSLVRGPHIRVEAGRYNIRIFGRAAGAVPASNVLAHGGQAVLSTSAGAPEQQNDVLAEHNVELVDRVDDLEVQMDISDQDHLCIHAVQIIPERPTAPARSQMPVLLRKPSAETASPTANRPALDVAVPTVQLLYRSLLGREADSTGLLHYAEMLNTGVIDERALARVLIGSSEYRQAVDAGTALAGLVTAHSKGCTFLIPEGAGLIGELAAEEGYEPWVLPYFLEQCHAGATVLDVGASIGAFSLPAARRVGSEGRVYAVEASPFNCRLLAQSIALNHLDNVELLPLGASDRTGYARMPQQIQSNNNAMEAGGETTPSEFMSHDIVPVLPLDLLRPGLRRIDVLKMDIEGMEYRACRGAIELIRADRPMVFLEYSPRFQELISGVEGRLLLELFRDLNYDFEILHRDQPRAMVADADQLDAVERAWQEHVDVGGTHVDLCLHPAAPNYPTDR